MRSYSARLPTASLTTACVLVVLAGCSVAPTADTRPAEGPQRAVVGVCPVIGTMQDCAGILTEIYRKADRAYSHLDSPTVEQTAAIRRMEEAGEFYAHKCRSLDVRAGAEINVTNGCDEALKQIVFAGDLVP